MRWKELFECDRPPCSSRCFVQISRNPFACCSQTPCSSRGFGGPCSSRRFGGDFGKFWNTVLARSSAVSWGACPGAKRLPDRTPTPILPNRQQRHQAKRVGLLRGGVFWDCCWLQQKDQISSAKNTSARKMGRLGHCSTVTQRRTELFNTEARGLSSDHESGPSP